MDYEAVYFGVLKEKGHYLYHEQNPNHAFDDPETIDTFPFNIYQIDIGLLESRRIPDVPDGKVYWTKAGSPLWFAFVWWDRSGDKRTHSNSGFYVRGFNQGSQIEAFKYACSKFPMVIDRQKFKLNLQIIESGFAFPQK